MTDSVAGTFNAQYSPDGQLTTLKYPSGMTRVDTLNANLEPVARTYKRDTDNTVIYSESVIDNSAGELTTHTFTGGSRTYTYDRLGRLTNAQDTKAASGCVTRAYGYDTLHQPAGPNVVQPRCRWGPPIHRHPRHPDQPQLRHRRPHHRPRLHVRARSAGTTVPAD